MLLSAYARDMQCPGGPRVYWGGETEEECTQVQNAAISLRACYVMPTVALRAREAMSAISLCVCYATSAMSLCHIRYEPMPHLLMSGTESEGCGTRTRCVAGCGTASLSSYA
eukprot:2702621-Rhodomonas_salina.2